MSANSKLCLQTTYARNILAVWNFDCLAITGLAMKFGPRSSKDVLSSKLVLLESNYNLLFFAILILRLNIRKVVIGAHVVILLQACARLGQG